MDIIISEPKIKDYENIEVTIQYNNADAVAAANSGNQWKFEQSVSLFFQAAYGDWSGDWNHSLSAGPNGYSQTIENGTEYKFKIPVESLIESEIDEWVDGVQTGNKIKVGMKAMKDYESGNEVKVMFKKNDQMGEHHIIKKVELVDPLVEYEYQDIAYFANPGYPNDLYLDGVFDTAKASQGGALVIEYTVEGEWRGFKVVNPDQSETYFEGGQNPGSYELALPLSEMVEKGLTSDEAIVLNLWADAAGNTVKITSVKARTVKGQDKIFIPVVHVSSVSLDKNNAVFQLNADGAVPSTMGLTATVLPSNADDKTVTWSVEDEDVCTVKDGVITPVGVGETTVTVTTKEGSKTATCTVKVEELLPTEIEISGADSTTVKGGDIVSLKVKTTPANAYNKAVTWTSSDAAVATVDANGKVTFANVDETKTVKITAVSKADASVKDEITFTVDKLVISNPVTGVTISDKTLEIKKGETGSLTATVAPVDASLKTVTWSSSDESVATVDSDGKVTAVGMGTATITVKTVDGEKTDSCEVTVTAPRAASVTVFVNGEEMEADEEGGKFKLSVMEGRNRKLTASALPEDAVQKFTFTSSDDSVVTVDEEGNLTAVAVGEAVITVSADGASKEISVTITEKSNVPYVTEEGTVIFDGKETTEGKWNPVAACREYFKQDGSIDFSIITEDSVIKAYYTCDKAPQLILQKYNDATLNWIKIDPYLTEDGVAYYSYEDMVKAFGDLSVADALYIADNGAVLTVTKVVVAKAETDNGSVSVDAKGEFKPAIEMSKEEVVAAIKNVLSEEQLAAIEDGTAKIEIELNIANIDDTVSQEDKDIIADAINSIADSDKLNFMVMNYLDITFGANVDGDVIKISETDGLITVSVALDEAVNGTYKVIRIHDGKAEVIDSELSEDGTRLTFKTDKFSTYAIVFADVASGDKTMPALIALFAIAGLAAALTVAVKIRKTARR